MKCGPPDIGFIMAESSFLLSFSSRILQELGVILQSTGPHKGLMDELNEGFQARGSFFCVLRVSLIL